MEESWKLQTDVGTAPRSVASWGEHEDASSAALGNVSLVVLYTASSYVCYTWWYVNRSCVAHWFGLDLDLPVIMEVVCSMVIDGEEEVEAATCLTHPFLGFSSEAFLQGLLDVRWYDAFELESCLWTSAPEQHTSLDSPSAAAHQVPKVLPAML